MAIEDNDGSGSSDAKITAIVKRFPIHWRAIVEGYEVLLENACDPGLKHLEFRSDIKNFLESQATRNDRPTP